MSMQDFLSNCIFHRLGLVCFWPILYFLLICSALMTGWDINSGKVTGYR